MALTEEFKNLSKTITGLRNTMLPSPFDPIGNYKTRWHDRTRGFLILCHAEIEDYLEDSCKKIVNGSIGKWNNAKSANPVLFALIVSYKLEWNIDNEIGFKEYLELTKPKKRKFELLREILNNANTQYISKVNGNNGIKEDNLKKLLIPISIDLDILDPLLITELNNYGTNRGKYAHNSGRTVTLLDPKTEYDSVKNLLELMKELDRIFYDLRLMTV